MTPPEDASPFEPLTEVQAADYIGFMARRDGVPLDLDATITMARAYRLMAEYPLLHEYLAVLREDDDERACEKQQQHEQQQGRGRLRLAPAADSIDDAIDPDLIF